MVSLTQIEQDLTAAMKAKDRLAVDTLRGLKTRLENERIAKLKDLSEEDIFTLVKSEIKKRKEAAAGFLAGGRQEMAEKEQQEAKLLTKYLPPQISEEQVQAVIDKIILENNFIAKDFGKAMGMLKAQIGSSADGSILAKLLKEKLS